MTVLFFFFFFSLLLHYRPPRLHRSHHMIRAKKHQCLGLAPKLSPSPAGTRIKEGWKGGEKRKERNSGDAGHRGMMDGSKYNNMATRCRADVT